MEFRHNNLTYDTEQLGPEAKENIARQAALARDTGKQTLKVLGFSEDHEFAKRVVERKPVELKFVEQPERSGFTLEH